MHTLAAALAAAGAKPAAPKPKRRARTRLQTVGTVPHPSVAHPRDSALMLGYPADSAALMVKRRVRVYPAIRPESGAVLTAAHHAAAHQAATALAALAAFVATVAGAPPYAAVQRQTCICPAGVPCTCGAVAVPCIATVALRHITRAACAVGAQYSVHISEWLNMLHGAAP